MKKIILQIRTPLLWVLLAIAGIIIYFTQIAARLSYPQAVIALLFFLITILDIDFSHISFHSLRSNLSSKKMTRKMILVVSILVVVASVSIFAGRTGVGTEHVMRSWHVKHQGEIFEPRPWPSLLMHSLTTLIGI